MFWFLRNIRDWFRFNFQFIININICDIYDIKKNIKKKYLFLNNFQIINFIFLENIFFVFPHHKFQFQPSPICFMFRVMFILFFKLNNLVDFLVLVSVHLLNINISDIEKILKKMKWKWYFDLYIKKIILFCLILYKIIYNNLIYIYFFM